MLPPVTTLSSPPSAIQAIQNLHAHFGQAFCSNSIGLLTTPQQQRKGRRVMPFSLLTVGHTRVQGLCL